MPKPPSLLLSIIVHIIYESYKLQYIGNLQTNTTAFIKYFLDWQQEAKTYSHALIQVLQVWEQTAIFAIWKGSLSLKKSLKEIDHILKDQPKYHKIYVC